MNICINVIYTSININSGISPGSGMSSRSTDLQSDPLQEKERK